MSYTIDNSWNNINPLSFDSALSPQGNYINGNWTSIKICENGQTLYAVNTNTPVTSIYISTNGGLNWTNINSNVPTSSGYRNYINVCCDLSNTQVYIPAFDNYVYGCINNGLNWSILVNQIYKWSLCYCCPSNPQFIIINKVYPNATYISNNGLSTMSLINSLSNFNNITSICMDYYGVNIIVTSSTSGVALSTDSGNNFSKISAEILPKAQWSSVSIDSTGNNMVVCSLDGYIYISNNGGISWTSCSPNNNLSWSCVKISLNANVIFACAVYGSIYYTSNNGSTWNTTNPSNLTLNWACIDCNNDASFVCASVDGGNIYTLSNL